MTRALLPLCLLLATAAGVFAADKAPLALRRQDPQRLGRRQKTWHVEDGAIVGGSLDAVVPRNEFLCTTRTFGNFELKVKFKLVGDRDRANAGVQFRTKRIPKHHEVSGYQADVGQGYWGACTTSRGGTKFSLDRTRRCKTRLSSTATGTSTSSAAKDRASSLFLNGTRTVDYTETDDKIERTGIIGLQIHGGAQGQGVLQGHHHYGTAAPQVARSRLMSTANLESR